MLNDNRGVGTDQGKRHFPLFFLRGFSGLMLRSTVFFFSLLEQVESPIVEYCEGLVSLAGDVQRRALQVYGCQRRCM